MERFCFLDVNSDLLQEEHDLGHNLILRKATLAEVADRQIEASFRMWSERRGTSVFINQRMPLDTDNASVSGSVLPNPKEWRAAVKQQTPIPLTAKTGSIWSVTMCKQILIFLILSLFICSCTTKIYNPNKREEYSDFWKKHNFARKDISF